MLVGMRGRQRSGSLSLHLLSTRQHGRTDCRCHSPARGARTAASRDLRVGSAREAGHLNLNGSALTVPNLLALRALNRLDPTPAVRCPRAPSHAICWQLPQYYNFCLQPLRSVAAGSSRVKHITPPAAEDRMVPDIADLPQHLRERARVIKPMSESATSSGQNSCVLPVICWTRKALRAHGEMRLLVWTHISPRYKLYTCIVGCRESSNRCRDLRRKSLAPTSIGGDRSRRPLPVFHCSPVRLSQMTQFP